MSPDRSKPQIACRTCGADITAHVRYNRRWTQCAVCYWKSRLDYQEPLEDLLRQRSEVRVRLEALTPEIEGIQATIKHHLAERRANSSFWRDWLRDVFCADNDPVFHSLLQRSSALEGELERAKQKHSLIEMQIKNVKKVKKRFLGAHLSRSAAEAKNRLKAQEHKRFCSDRIGQTETKKPLFLRAFCIL